MSYLVLARKYRPRNFTEMVGQEHVVQALANALTSQRLHHAYLFTGTRGVGKTTVSRILAKSLNCLGSDGQGGITATPCGVCQACQDIDAGRFVDYTELDAASNRGVDEVQSLLEQAVYKPVQGRFKVFMIDEVHMLTNHAFNAMLKTLEEPPAYLKFVLATTDPQKVPVTVLSRCLQFNLRPMAPETVLEHLQSVLASERVSADLQALRLIARAARGSMRDALSLTDQAIAFGSGQLQEAAVRRMLGAVDRSYVFRLIDALARGDGRSVVETTETLRLNGLNAASTLEEMTTVLQRMAVLQAVPGIAGDDATDPDATETARLSAALPADQTQLLYSLCLHGRGELGLAPDEYAALTMVLLRLLAFQPEAPRGPAEKKTLKPDTAAAATSAAPPAAQPARPVAATPAAVQQPGRSLGRHPDAVPPGQTLPVIDPAPPAVVSQEKQTPPGVSRPPAATEIVAIPVREQTEPQVPAPVQADVGGAFDAPPGDPTAGGDGDFWHALVGRLIDTEAITALARELALQSQLVARDGDDWLLRIERESLNQSGTRERLLQALKAAGYPARLVIEVGRVTDSPARRNARAAAEKLREAEALIQTDPFVQAMMRDFGAKIVPGSIKPL